MTQAFALLAALLLSGSASAGAQDRAGTVAQGTADQAQPAPDPRPGEVRPKRGGWMEVIKTVLPPLIDAATTRPPPAPAPPRPVIAPAPMPDEPPLQPAASAPAASVPAPSKPAAVIAPVTPPRPVRAKPGPAEPMPPSAAPRPATPAAEPVRPDPVEPAPRPSIVPTLSAPPPAAPAPTVMQSPPPAAPAPTALPSPAPVTANDPPRAELSLLARLGGGTTLLLLGLLAVAVVASVWRVRKMRRIAWTRAALALRPRLDLGAGACSTSGLALTGPPLAIRARLVPAGHG